MSYRSEVLADNPTHYWPFAEVGGLIVSDLQDANGTGVSVAQSNGYKGAASGEGSAFINNVSNNAFLALKTKGYASIPCTFEAWVWLYAITGTYQEILMYGTSAQSLELLVQATNGKLQWNNRGVAAPFQLNGATALTPGGWHHVVGTLTAGAGKLYLDGSVDASGTINASPLASSAFGLGGFTDRTQPINGYIGSCAIYASELSAARIAAHYAAADFKTNVPIYFGASSFQQAADISAAVAAVKADTAAILAAVRTTFT